MEMSRKSSEFSMKYENARYETSPIATSGLLEQHRAQFGKSLQLNDLSDMDQYDHI